ncbi:lysylphosphatidylglycerol synthase transmembrane domain-containing protein [Sulfitobacter aestuarii]|uniref:Lysylphosphatidylglycerol synthase transmembrane domain-containing protein n=1 Tax=Sulfitobacter aestuarii TaxID=2161676 RepID=A0ABW5U4L0_9RHOB
MSKVDEVRPMLLTRRRGQPDSGASKPSRNWWLFAIKLLASAGLIAWILLGANLSEVGAALRDVDLRWIGLAMLLQCFGAAIISRRWQGLLAVQDVRPPWLYLFRSTIVSSFFRQFLPSIIGGDVIRSHDAWRAGASLSLALMSLLLDRLLGLLALALLALLAMLSVSEVTERLPALQLWLICAFAGLAAILSLVVLPRRRTGGGAARLPGFLPDKLRRKLGDIGKAMTIYRGKSAALWRGLALSLLLQVNVVTFYWALSQALGLPLSYGSFFAIAPIAIFVMMIPISINGIGVREAIFLFLLAQWGIGSAEALALAWLEYGTFLAFGLLGGIVYALRRY